MTVRDAKTIEGTATDSWDVNDRISSIRADKGLSRAAFSCEIGVNPSKIQDIERHRYRAGTSLIAAVSDAYRVNPEWLLHGVAPKYLTNCCVPEDDSVRAVKAVHAARATATSRTEIEEARQVRARYDTASQQVDALLAEMDLNAGPLLRESLRMLAMEGIAHQQLLMLVQGIKTDKTADVRR